MKNNILFEDDHVVVIYKPAGIATQTARLGQQDMVSELKNYLASKPEYFGKGEPYVGLIHRLDQPVEGILVFAKTKQGAADLSRQITEHTFEKYYLALIFGKASFQNELEEEATLTNYLYKDSKTNTSKVVVEQTKDAKLAKLACKQLNAILLEDTTGQEKHGVIVSKVEIKLETGRHHQIRVQMSYADMPIVGDTRYGTEYSKEMSRQIQCHNLALCAYKIKFQHPKTQENMTFEIQPKGQIFKKYEDEKYL